MPKKSASYQDLSEALDQVLAQLQAPDVRVDDAAQLYKQGLELITALEAQLKAAENVIKKLSLQTTEKSG